jgi:2-polyprenyl-6-methoxyphenol hydroxylase-like FAD-dependent oxidoreductase
MVKPNSSLLSTEPAAIVGGGAGGLASALALAVHGVPSRVFERSVSSHDIDRGDVIHFASERLMRGWRAWEYVEALSPVRFTCFQILDGEGRRLLGLDTARQLRPDCHLTALRHSDIVQALRAAASATGLVELHDGQPVTELSTDSGRVRGVRTTAGDYPALLTIVATGTRSKLRDQYFGRPRTHDYNRSFFNARVRAIERYRGCGYYVLGRRGILIMVTLPNDELRIGVQFVTSERLDRPFEHNFAEHAARILRPLEHESVNFIQGHAYRLQASVATRWSVPGAVLLGDAAHTVHPTGGQGMNLAFKDAHTLAELVAHAHTPGDLDAACVQYAHVRRRQVRPVYLRAHAGGLMAGLTRPAAVAARANAVRLLDRVPPLKRSLFERLVDVR